ncbi:hypothetical protein SUDANB121_03344 [Nocardiopsis dassonvillei]
MFRDCSALSPNTANGAPRRIRGAPRPTGYTRLTSVHSSGLTRHSIERLGRGGPYGACWRVGSGFTCQGGTQPPIPFFLRRSPGSEKVVGPTFHPGFPNRYTVSRGNVGSVVPDGNRFPRFPALRQMPRHARIPCAMRRDRPGTEHTSLHAFRWSGGSPPPVDPPEGRARFSPQSREGDPPALPPVAGCRTRPARRACGRDVHPPPCAHPARRFSESADPFPAPSLGGRVAREPRPHGAGAADPWTAGPAAFPDTPDTPPPCWDRGGPDTGRDSRSRGGARTPGPARTAS